MKLKKSSTLSKNNTNQTKQKYTFSMKKPNLFNQETSAINNKMEYVTVNKTSTNKNNTNDRHLQENRSTPFSRKLGPQSQTKYQVNSSKLQQKLQNESVIFRKTVRNISNYKPKKSQNQKQNIIQVSNPQKIKIQKQQKNLTQNTKKKYQFLNTRKSKMQSQIKKSQNKPSTVINNKSKNINIHKLTINKNHRKDEKILIKNNQIEEKKQKTQEENTTIKKQQNEISASNFQIKRQNEGTSNQNRKIEQQNKLEEQEPIQIRHPNNHQNSLRQREQQHSQIERRFLFEESDHLSSVSSRQQPINNLQQRPLNQNITSNQNTSRRNNYFVQQRPNNLSNNNLSNNNLSNNNARNNDQNLNQDLQTLVQNTRDIIDFINRLSLSHRIQSFELMISQLTQLNLIAQQVQQLGQMGNNLGYTMVNVFGTRIRQLQTTIINQIGQALILSFEQRFQPQFQALVLRQPALRTGFSKKQIQQIFQQKILFQESQCSICLDILKPGDMTIELQCYHQYHPLCIKTWLENSKKCPMCRTQQVKN